MNIYSPWMKNISFSRVINIFALISKTNTGLSFIDIEKAGRNNGTFKKINEKFLSASSIHCYLNTMKRLNLIDYVSGHYVMSKDEKAIKLFESLNNIDAAKEALAFAVVSNPDCRHYFFDLMMTTEDYELEDLRKKGTPIKLLTQDMEAASNISKNVEYSKPKPNLMNIIALDGRKLFLKSIAEKDAVFNGIRKWSLELGIVDELLPSFSSGYLVAPIKISESEAKIKQEVLEEIHFKLSESSDTWAHISIPALVFDIFTTKRYSVDTIKNAISNISNEYSSCMILSPTSSAMVELGTPYFKQMEILFKSYLKNSGGTLLSHLSINVKDFNEKYDKN